MVIDYYTKFLAIRGLNYSYCNVCAYHAMDIINYAKIKHLYILNRCKNEFSKLNNSILLYKYVLKKLQILFKRLYNIN